MMSTIKHLVVHWFHTVSAIIFIHLGSCVTPSLIPELINDSHGHRQTNWTNTIACPKHSNLTHLKLLDISHNKFRTLFADVFRGLKRLEVLDLSNGHIKYIDEHAFDGLEMLKELNIENNQLSSIYLELFQSILNLSVLNVGGNSISHLTGGIFASMTGLRKLVLSRNRLISINDNAFVGLELLEELYLNDNHLTRVPSIALQSLKRIITIDMDANPLEQLLTGDFVHIPVNRISMANCKQLTLVDKGAFWDLPNVNTILLHSNPSLQYIDSQAFLGVPLLHSLQLHDCALNTFQHDIIDYVLNDQHIHSKHKLKITFQSNPILCDCNIQYLYQECAPKIVTIGKQNVTIHKKIGDRHVFQCKALGLPVPKIIWILPNEH
ncbi:unnamed protein product [Medioppia subpectinata]|uniref:Uncharacterized protein n=1 Tax=Medioppia subpectinata TaxID=1979941 RepID=A0A7R9Q2S9_9ACAR|nr:unnamed protein product [Medioppia subpectinata]CAG2110596.1 unnamed protein product [Medioppia subpectinata]